MKPGDFLLYTLEGDTGTPPNTLVAEIVSVDPQNSFFTCDLVDSVDQVKVQYSSDANVSWQGEDGSGTSFSLATHNIYTPGAVDPAADGVAAVTFADGSRYFGYVDSVSPTVDVTFYQQPLPKVSIGDNTITQSDWDAYPMGEEVCCIEGYVANNDLPAAVATEDLFPGGWWASATRRDANSGRVGGFIQPFAVVVHTTDIPPDSLSGLLDRWTGEPGNYDCAHFVIGRDASIGVVQLVPITRNANHAGAANACIQANGIAVTRNADKTCPAGSVNTVLHGWFVAGAQKWHPNSVSIGIEVHCAGRVVQEGGVWLWKETGSANVTIPDEDVVPDPARSGVGYHTVTQYQYEQLSSLLEALEGQLVAMPDGCVAQSYEQVPPYGQFPTARRVGHVSLDARERGDPWPPTCDWMRTS